MPSPEPYPACGDGLAAPALDSFPLTTASASPSSFPLPRQDPSLRRDNAFPLFPFLPPEVRLHIWSLNLPSCRLVPLYCGAPSRLLTDDSSDALSSPRHSGSNWTGGCTSPLPMPVNFHVCVESRAEAFKSYSRAFGFACRPGRIIFNPRTDILFFGPRRGFMAADSQFHTCMSMCDQDELARVRRIAVSDSLFWIDDMYRSMTAASLTVEVIQQLAKRMPRLELMMFVPRHEDETTDLEAVKERMRRQIQMALATVCQKLPHWIPPPWQIVCLSALPSIDSR